MEGALAICIYLAIRGKTPYLCTIDPQNLAEALGKCFFIELFTIRIRLASKQFDWYWGMETNRYFFIHKTQLHNFDTS